MGASFNAGGYGPRRTSACVPRRNFIKQTRNERRNSLRRNLIIATRYNKQGEVREAPSSREQNRDKEGRRRGIKAEGEGPKNAWKGIKSVRETSVIGREEEEEEEEEANRRSVELNFEVVNGGEVFARKYKYSIFEREKKEKRRNIRSF